MSKADQEEVMLRVTIRKPPAGVLYGLQKGKAEVVDTKLSSGADLSFEWTMPAEPMGEGVRFTGPFAQGPPAERFVYVNAGTCAGQMGSCWTRRMKLALKTVEWAMVEAGGVIEATFEGTGRDGGPTSGTVGFLDGWKVAKRRTSK